MTDERPYHWTDDALCAQVDPELFFPDPGIVPSEARGVCRNCPVTAPCLETALLNDERFGVWGGMSARDREKLTAREKKLLLANLHLSEEEVV